MPEPSAAWAAASRRSSRSPRPERATTRPSCARSPSSSSAPNPAQPRKRFDEAGLTALADSLAERGVLQPVLVRPRPGGSYELVAGERRWRAAQLAGLDTMPALVQHRDDEASLEVALIENMAREDLNPVEAARAVAALVEELGLTREEVGRRVGRSRVAISNLLRLLDLPDEALALRRGRRAQRGPRPRAAARRRPRRAPPPRSRRGGGGAGRCACSSSAPASRTPARAPRAGAAAALHPDQEAAAAEIAEALGAALGTEVRVRPRGTGYKVELAFDSAEDAVALAARVRPSALA